MSDKTFNEIISLLEEIHVLAPTMKFGNVIQLSMDRHKNKRNQDLSQISTKSYAAALKNFRTRIIGGKL